MLKSTSAFREMTNDTYSNWQRGSQGLIRSDGLHLMMIWELDNAAKREVAVGWKFWGQGIRGEHPLVALPEVVMWIDKNYPIAEVKRCKDNE